MNRFTKPLIVFFFLFVAGSLLPALGLHRAAAATITLTLVDSYAEAGVTITNLPDGSHADGHEEGETFAFTEANYDVDNWGTAKRYSATFVDNTINPSVAALALYGTHHGEIQDGFQADGGGVIESRYEMTVTSDYGAVGSVAAHIIIPAGNVPGGTGQVQFTIWEDDNHNHALFSWYGDEGSGADDLLMLTYGESYYIEGLLNFSLDAESGGPLMGPASLERDFSTSMQIQVDETPVPLPGALWLLGSGLLGLTAVRRRRKL